MKIDILCLGGPLDGQMSAQESPAVVAPPGYKLTELKVGGWGRPVFVYLNGERKWFTGGAVDALIAAYRASKVV